MLNYIKESTPLCRQHTNIVTLPQLLGHRIRTTPNAIAYGCAQESVTWQTFGERVDALAVGLLRLGLKPGDTVGIIGPTTGEWTIADQAILAIGGIGVGIYPTLTPTQASYILNDAQTKAIFVGDSQSLELVREIVAEVTPLQHVIVWGCKEHNHEIKLTDLITQGTSISHDEAAHLERTKACLCPDDTALLIYTSGTTGKPKGVMLTHWNCIFEVRTMEHLSPKGIETENTLSFLPMAHVAEHVLGFYGRINTGVSTYFVGSLDGQDILRAAQREQPTLLGVVPRIFEKAYSEILLRVQRGTWLRRMIFCWAQRIAMFAGQQRRQGVRLSLRHRLSHWLADGVLFRRIRGVFGGKVKWFACGAAALDGRVLDFFEGAGFQIIEAYGLTECCGAATTNRFAHRRLGTVGQPLPGTEIRIAPDGEVLVRGPHVFKGYWQQPEATQKVLDPQGWLHTGDLGTLDDDGFLTLIGRKDHMIVTSLGKNIAPEPIEAALLGTPVIGHVLVLGEHKPYITALMTVDPQEGEQLTGLSDPQQLTIHPRVLAIIKEAVLHANQSLARYERIRRYGVLPDVLTVSGGGLTPTYKLRRRALRDRWSAHHDALYATPLRPWVVNLGDGTQT